MLEDYNGTVWRVKGEDLRGFGLRPGETAIVFSAEKHSRRWTRGIPSTLRFLAIDELRSMLEKAKAVQPVPGKA